MGFPELWEEARKAPEFVEVARPIHQGRAELLVNQRRQPSDSFRERARVPPAVDDGEGVVATPFDDDLPVPDLYRFPHVVGSLRERIVDEVLDDLEHPHQDVLVLVGQEAGGPVGEEMARHVRDEHVLHSELGRAAPPPDHERSRKPARGRDRRPGGEVGGLPFPSVKASVNTKLPAPASGGASKLIPKTTEPSGAMEGSVQLYRLPWSVRGNEPLSEMNRGPLGTVVLSQPIPAEWPVLWTVTVRTNRADVFTWRAEAFMASWRVGAESVTVSDVDVGVSRFPFPSVG